MEHFKNALQNIATEEMTHNVTSLAWTWTFRERCFRAIVGSLTTRNSGISTEPLDAEKDRERERERELRVGPPLFSAVAHDGTEEEKSGRSHNRSYTASTTGVVEIKQSDTALSNPKEGKTEWTRIVELW